MIWWNLNALQETASIDVIVVATDCEEIASTVENFGLSKVTIYKRLAANATDEASTESVMLEYLEKNKHSDDDIFILSQLTSPFTTSKHFSEAIAQLKSEEADSLLTCVPFKRFLWTKEGSPKNYNPNQRPRRQEFEGDFMENGAFYISRIGLIKSSKNRLSGNISIYQMPEHTDIELDEPLDWIIAEKVMIDFQNE